MKKNKDKITGQFIFNGGKKSELRDKKCPFCDKLIMRKSITCRSCHQIGSKSHWWKDAKPICPICKLQKLNYSKGICRNCYRGSLHFAFKRNGVGYTSLHDWVRRYLGKPTFCSNNIFHLGKRYVWANVSGEYKRDLKDWHSLCNSCNLSDGIKIPIRFRRELNLNV